MSEQALTLSRRLVEQPVCWETMILCWICTLDMLSSAYLFQAGLAVEANPLLRPSAEAGIVPFLTAKSLTYLPALGYMEWLRWHRPQFAVTLLRLACALYTVIYVVPALLQCV